MSVCLGTALTSLKPDVHDKAPPRASRRGPMRQCVRLYCLTFILRMSLLPSNVRMLSRAAKPASDCSSV
jgi:hypothetical protein